MFFSTFNLINFQQVYYLKFCISRYFPVLLIFPGISRRPGNNIFPGKYNNPECHTPSLHHWSSDEDVCLNIEIRVVLLNYYVLKDCLNYFAVLNLQVYEHSW